MKLVLRSLLGFNISQMPTVTCFHERFAIDPFHNTGDLLLMKFARATSIHGREYESQERRYRILLLVTLPLLVSRIDVRSSSHVCVVMFLNW